MKLKPQPPKFEVYHLNLHMDIYGRMSLFEILKMVKERYFALKQSGAVLLELYEYGAYCNSDLFERIHIERVENYGDVETVVTLSLDLKQEVKDVRIAEYHAKLRKWQQWYEENKDRIDEDERKRKASAERGKVAKVKRDRVNLERQIVQLQKRLGKLS